MKRKPSGRHKLIGAASSVLAIVAAGCASPPGELLDAIPASNARTAYLTVKHDGGEGMLSDATQKVGGAASTIGRTPTSLDYKIQSDDVHDITGMVSATGEAYGKFDLDWPGGAFMSGFAQITPIADADGDGVKDDSFLMMTRFTPEHGRDTEFTAAYQGNWTPTTALEPLRANSHKATYLGTGEVRAAVGDRGFVYRGDSTLVADFGAQGTGISGMITTPGAEGFDNVGFAGRFTRDLSDFVIGDVQLKKGSTAVTGLSIGGGSGSFVGAKAGGVMGAFSARTSMTDGGALVNVLGTFHGTTQDNK